MDAKRLEFLRSLVEYPEETAEVEYKSGILFDSKSDFSTKLVKHILGMANAGGGYIVLGFGERSPGRLAPDPGLDESVSRSYETTRLSQSVDSFVTGGQRVQLQVHHIEYRGKSYPVISVRGFERSPLFCKKDVTGQDGKLILREGAIYIRDQAAKTVTVAGAEQFSVLLNLAVEQRKTEIVQQVRTLLDGSQSLTSSSADEMHAAARNAQAWFESENVVAVTQMKTDMSSASAYFQVTHYPHAIPHVWSQQELIEAMRKAACHNTGWPMGVVLNKPEVAPKPLKDGIRAVIYSTFITELFDYWTLQRNGRYFFLRSLSEESESHGKNKVFFDRRIWDCAECLVHCANLYKELQVPPETEISISVKHTGLAGRVLSAGGRRRLAWERKSEEAEVTWEKKVPLSTIDSDLHILVEDVTNELFSVFEYWRPDPSVFNSVLGEFLSSRV